VNRIDTFYAVFSSTISSLHLSHQIEDKICGSPTLIPRLRHTSV
jgi:hypothetical protein